jgi:hypothetical protein
MEKNRPMLIIILWIVLGFAYSPFFIAAWVLHIVARLLLALAYFGMLEGYRGKNVFLSVFHNYPTIIG